MKYDAIIEKLTNLTGPDRYIDAEVAALARIVPTDKINMLDSMMSDNPVWKPDEQHIGMVRGFQHNGTPGITWPAGEFTGSTEAALEMVNSRLPDWIPFITEGEDGFTCMFVQPPAPEGIEDPMDVEAPPPNPNTDMIATHAIEAVAVTIAFLEAMLTRG